MRVSSFLACRSVFFPSLDKLIIITYLGNNKGKLDQLWILIDRKKCKWQIRQERNAKEKRRSISFWYDKRRDPFETMTKNLHHVLRRQLGVQDVRALFLLAELLRKLNFGMIELLYQHSQMGDSVRKYSHFECFFKITYFFSNSISNSKNI